MNFKKPKYKIGDKIKINKEEVEKDKKVCQEFINYIPMHNKKDLFITKVMSKEYSNGNHLYQINALFNLQESEVILIERCVENEKK